MSRLILTIHRVFDEAVVVDAVNELLHQLDEHGDLDGSDTEPDAGWTWTLPDGRFVSGRERP